ncbi:unnamed protein product [Linum trigynum]|uniref:Uncharacterized protein n=1 Tax=Linum trigynum TaxID=586398 RepID=A0AAV2FPT2_9ROSI
MRGALSTLFAWSCWLGEAVLQILASLFLTSVVNQQSANGDEVASDAGGGARSRDRKCCLAGLSRGPQDFRRCPNRVLCKRKCHMNREDQNPSFESTLSLSISVKKRRITRRTEWRFWLPSPLDLVGDKLLLSMSDELINDIGVPKEEPLFHLGHGGRDFELEAAEVRLLNIHRSMTPRPRGDAGRFEGKTRRCSVGPVTPPPKDLGICSALAIDSGLHPPISSWANPGGDFILQRNNFNLISSVLIDGYQCVPAKRRNASEEPIQSRSTSPIRTLSLPLNSPLRMGFSQGRGPLFIPIPAGRSAISIQLLRRPGEPTATRARYFAPPTRSCSGILHLLIDRVSPLSLLDTAPAQPPVVHPCPLPPFVGYALVNEVLGGCFLCF